MLDQIDHSQQLKAAKQTGYLDMKERGVFTPKAMHCTCIACRHAYLKGNDEAFREMIGKKH